MGSGHRDILNIFQGISAQTNTSAQPQVQLEQLGGTPVLETSDRTRRKRRKLTPPEDVERSWLEQLEDAAEVTRPQTPGSAEEKPQETKTASQDEQPTLDGSRLGSSDRLVFLENSHLRPSEAGPDIHVPHSTVKSPETRNAKKILKLNGAGGLGSPNTKDPVIVSEYAGIEPSRPRAPKTRKLKRGFIVLLHYGKGDADRRKTIGETIDRILDPPSDAIKPASTITPASRTAVLAPKPTHPFFTGKPPMMAKSADSNPVRESQTTVHPETQLPKVTTSATPGKLRLRKNMARPESPVGHVAIEPRSDRIFRLPGTTDASWPYMGAVRIVPNESGLLSSTIIPSLTLVKTKRKNRAARVDQEEDLLRHFRNSLCNENDGRKFVDFLPIAYHPHRPQRLVISGETLKKKALVELYGASMEGNNMTHPAFVRMLNSITSLRSAFDLGVCENLSWTQKYAPKAVAEVLQSDKELDILKLWLDSQTVSGTGFSSVLSKSIIGSGKALFKSKDGQVKRRRKRRKVSEELDDFIVNSDDDTSILKDLSDAEGPAILDEPVRSLVEDFPSKDNPRKANAILISGPHGCGKSAAVIAVAKELNFEVFEIGPNSRRSGKDILDKVGDMALNHQVSRTKKGLAQHSDTDGHDTEDTEISLGEPSHDQTTLNSFFAKHKAPLPRRGPKPSKLPTKEKIKTTEKQGSHRKQSLILLEEVDVLFEQDRAFWETVMQLALHSRRPIVMTCNDESLIPISDLSLHALLRFRPPPIDVASEYLLLLAAAEGHLLDLESVTSLFKSKDRDLRASIAELDFWCQMAVADPKGGMKWFLDCWPPGADADENGDKLRVVSLKTYPKPSEVLGQDGFVDGRGTLKAEDLVYEAWEANGLHPSHLSAIAIQDLAAERVFEYHEQHPRDKQFANLCEMEAMTDMLSASDVSCRMDLLSVNTVRSQYDNGTSSILNKYSQSDEILDPSQPPLMPSQRAEYTEGHTLLQSNIRIDYGQVNARLQTTQHTWLSSYMRAQCVSTLIQPSMAEKMHMGGTNSLPLSYNYDLVRNVKLLLSAVYPFKDPLFAQMNNELAATEIVPYVRSIAYYEDLLETQRMEFSGKGKKARMTRAARSAIEGGQRSKTRRDRWFGNVVDLKPVLSARARLPIPPLAISAVADHSAPASSSEGVAQATADEPSG